MVHPLVMDELSSSVPNYKDNFMVSIVNPTVVNDIDPYFLEQDLSILEIIVTSHFSSIEEVR